MSEITREKVWEMMEDIGICMLITWDGTRQRARPMAAMPREKEHAIYFFTDVAAEKDDQIENFPIVTTAFVDKSKNDYVSVTGRAAIVNDRAKIKELFNPMVKAWWDDAEDPAIRLIKLTPEDAEAWDSPHGPISEIKMLTAAMTGSEPDMGDNAKLRM